jgi:hypothetical protein
MAELIGQLTPFEVDVYLDNKIKAIDGRVEQLETDAGTNVNGVTFIELKSITTQPVTSELNDLYWNATDKKIYKKGVSVWGTSDVGEMGSIYKHGTKYYKYTVFGLIKTLLEIGDINKYVKELEISETLSVNGDVTFESDLNVISGTSKFNNVEIGMKLDMKTKKIENLSDPTADQDGATKKYVDNAITPQQVMDDAISFGPDVQITSFLSVSYFRSNLSSYKLTFKDGGNDIKILGTFIVDNDETFFTFSYYSVAKSGIVMFKVHIYNGGVDEMYISIEELTELAPTITVPVITIKRLIK